MRSPCLGVLALALLPLAARGDTCPVPLYTEDRPGPWPPTILEKAPDLTVTDTPHRDGRPLEPGRFLRFYRVNVQTSARDDLHPLIFLERSGDGALVRWGGGGDPRPCCTDGECRDLCPLVCGTVSGVVGAVGASCADDPPPCGADPCDLTMTFDDGTVPDGWQVLDYEGVSQDVTPGTIRNGRLEADPVNWGQQVRGPFVLPAGVRSVTVEFDALNAPSLWGMYTHLQPIAEAAAFEVTSMNGEWREGPDTVELWSSGPSGETPIRVFPLEYGPHHHRVVLRDGSVERQLTNLDTGALVADFVEDLPQLELSQLRELLWRVYVTTGETTWGDDLTVRCEF